MEREFCLTRSEAKKVFNKAVELKEGYIPAIDTWHCGPVDQFGFSTVEVIFCDLFHAYVGTVTIEVCTWDHRHSFIHK